MTDPASLSYRRDNEKIHITIPLRFSDMDANGHIFFGNYFTIFDTAFLHFLDIIGYSFERFCQNTLTLYYVEAASQYKAPVKYTDQLEVGVWIEKLGRTSFTVKFGAFNHTSGSNAATGKIIAVVVDSKTEKPVPLPDAFRHLVERGAQSADN